MCVVSAVIDNYEQWRPNIFKKYDTEDWPTLLPPQDNKIYPFNYASKEEVEELRKEIQMLKDILIKAKLFDDETGQMDCEKVEKVAMLKKIAKALDIDLDDVL